MPKPLKRYGPVSTRARAAGLEIQEDGDFLLREDVVRMCRQQLRTERGRSRKTSSEEWIADRAIAALESLLARLGEKP